MRRALPPLVYWFIAMLLAPGAARGVDETITTVQLTRFNGVEIGGAVGDLIWRGGLQLNSPSDDFGGLSGAPLRARSTAVVARLAQQLGGRVPVIGVGGIASAADAANKLQAGASLVQLYSSLVFKGPGLVGNIVAGLAQSR